MGLSQTSPAYATYTVQPMLGGVDKASVKVPTPHGFIIINATAHSTVVDVPCNTRASLCALVPPPSAGGADLHFALYGEIMLDDAVRIDGNHACADNVGCGVGGALRTVAFV